MFQWISLRKGTLTDDNLTTRWSGILDMRAHARAWAERADAEEEMLRKDAYASGLGAKFEEKKNPQIEAPPDRDEPDVRCKVVESSFCQPYKRFEYDGQRGDVIDIPKGLFKALRRVGFVERVDAGTPLRRQQAIPWR
jgi:hypothetical protein